MFATSVELEKHAAEMVGKIKVQKENVLILRLHAMDITVAHRLCRRLPPLKKVTFTLDNFGQLKV